MSKDYGEYELTVLFDSELGIEDMDDIIINKCYDLNIIVEVEDDYKLDYTVPYPINGKNRFNFTNYIIDFTSTTATAKEEFIDFLQNEGTITRYLMTIHI